MTEQEPQVVPTRVRDAIALVVATICFGLALALRDRFDPWRSTALAAVLALGLSVWALGRARLARLFALAPVGAGLAIALGGGLVVATHVVFELVPAELRNETRTLYAAIDVGIPRPLLALITTGVVLAEELVWRGVALELVTRRSPRLAGLLAIGLYVVPQLLGGAWLLVLAAVGLGTVFTVQRQVTGRLTDPLLTHAIWSVSIFVLVPLA